MNKHVQDRLAYYRDLAAEERRAVDAHLATCEACRSELAAYERQDAALADVRLLRPRRAWQPGQPRISLPRRAAARLGDGLVLAALAALLWLFALQVQTLSQPGTSLQPAAAPEPGVALPPTRLQLPSPWVPALPWVVGALLSSGTLFVLSRRSLAATLLGAGAAGLLLISFIPPLSLVPNPVAFYWRIAGGYSYDPRLPFKNNFLLAGSPESQLRPYLDALVGQTGLAPLDPNLPLERYEILRVGLHSTENRVALVTTRFIYADGSSRVYPVPMFSPALDFLGFWLAGWSEDGLGRLRSEHIDLPGQPFATAASPIQLGEAQRLDLHPRANRLDEANPAHWLWNSVRLNHLTPAPDGGAFLLTIELDSAKRQLWYVPLDGAEPIAIDGPADIREYGWSPDGRWIVYTRFDPEASAVQAFRPYAIVTVARPSGASASSAREGGVIATGLATAQLPGLSQPGLWFISNGGLWRAPYEGGTPSLQIAEVVSSLAPRVTGDGARLAYACRGGVCISDADGGQVAVLSDVSPAEMAWSPDGTRLAIVSRDLNNLRPVELIIASRAGVEQIRVEIAPRDVTDAPQWAPDGGAVFIQTFPQDGRRIIAVDLASRQVIDLSREHWDAYFALMPDGRRLLLNNGRGDFWIADVRR